MQLKKQLIAEVQAIISQARTKAIRSVNTERVLMYWQIGKVIFEEEQQDKYGAEYAKFLIKSLSQHLQPRFGSGFSIRQLGKHDKLLIRIENQDKRSFYTAETEKNNWSTRQLERQINSQLFERLLMSNDVESVLEIAKNEKQLVQAC